MGRKTKLTRKLIKPIVKAIKRRMTQKQIADFLGIDPKTFRNWRERGLREEKGIYRELADAMERAEAEIYYKAVGVLQKAMMGGEKTRSTKVVMENGIPVKTEITEKTLGANWNAALAWLERSDPEAWGRYETLRIESDLRVEVESLGLDLEVVLQAAVVLIERLMESKGAASVEDIVQELSAGDSENLKVIEPQPTD